MCRLLRKGLPRFQSLTGLEWLAARMEIAPSECWSDSSAAPSMLKGSRFRLAGVGERLCPSKSVGKGQPVALTVERRCPEGLRAK